VASAVVATVSHTDITVAALTTREDAADTHADLRIEETGEETANAEADPLIQVISRGLASLSKAGIQSDFSGNMCLALTCRRHG
jgi:hypothetical protein